MMPGAFFCWVSQLGLQFLLDDAKQQLGFDMAFLTNPVVSYAHRHSFALIWTTKEALTLSGGYAPLNDTSRRKVYLFQNHSRISQKNACPFPFAGIFLLLSSTDDARRIVIYTA
jgi:hypothetical protein